MERLLDGERMDNAEGEDIKQEMGELQAMAIKKSKICANSYL